MEGREFLDVAKSLARSKLEASLRSAISRAYYALFNSAATFLDEQGFPTQQGPGGHGQVVNRLSNCNLDQMIKFSHVLDELRWRRNDADYDMGSLEFQNQVTCALRIKKAEIALQLLNDYTKEPLRNHIRDGIRDYERKLGK